MNDEPLILEIDIIGGGSAMAQMEAMAKSVKSIDAPISKASTATQNLTKNLRAAGGPADRLYKALQQVRNANMHGDPADRFDANYKFQRAQVAYGKAQASMQPKSSLHTQPNLPPSLMSRLGGVLSSSRFSMGGGGHGPKLMPLVGQTMKALAPEIGKIAGGLGNAAAGLLKFGEAGIIAYAAYKVLEAVIGPMAEAAAAAAKALTEFKNAMITSGGTAQETAALQGYGKIAGVSDMAGLSRQFADRISNDGSAAAFANGAGIHDNGGAFSQMDKAKNLELAIDHIISSSVSDAEAARFARVEGLEQFLQMRDLTDDMKNNFKESTKMAASIVTPEATHNAAAYNMELNRMGTEWDTLVTRMQAHFLPVITSLITLAANALHELNIALAWMERMWMRLMGVPDKPKTEEDAARKDHAAAMREHSAALKNGIYGGGERARGAIPYAWGGMNSKNWSGMASALGAMSL